jgi:N-acetylglucosamine-6-phosphate deacetylase
MTAQFLTHAAVLCEGEWHTGQGVLLEGGLIRAVLPEHHPVAAARVSLPSGSLLAPGLIDIQVNGGGGLLFNDRPDAEAARHIARAHRRLGTTGILPTLITSDRDTFVRAVAAARQFVAPESGILGVHFEGPFLSPARPGVHSAALIRPPEEDDLALLTSLAAGLPGAVLLTVAPECASPDIWHRPARAGIILSAGHSAAHYEEITPSVTGVTHLFNAMNPPAARDPGLVAAALLSDRYAGVILDGHHVHPAMLRLLLATKTADRIMLVSDSMAVAGTDATAFMLQGRRILRRDGRLMTENGTLAGADLSLAQAVRNATTMLGLSLEAALCMASATPAAFLGLAHRHGSIAAGRQADLVLLDAQSEVLGTWLAGVWETA